MSDDGYDYRTNPPPNDGKKVIVNDTDHLWGIGGNLDWAWKSFVRGDNLLFMDPYEGQILGRVTEERRVSFPLLRKSFGQIRRLSERIDLAAMTPHEELASTKFCLADPGKEYVVYLPEGGNVELDLSAVSGQSRVEWIPPVEGAGQQGHDVAGSSKATLQAPFAGPAVLYVKAR